MSGATRHWWLMRVSSALLVPLSLWFVWAGTRLATMDHAAASAFLSGPINAAALILFAAVGLYHTVAGTQEVIEDYVPGAGAATALVWLLRAAGIAAFAGVGYALFRLGTGA